MSCAEPVRRNPDLPHGPYHRVRRNSVLRACCRCVCAGSAPCSITRIAVRPATVSGNRDTAGATSRLAAATAAIAAIAGDGAATARSICRAEPA